MKYLVDISRRLRKWFDIFEMRKKMGRIVINFVCYDISLDFVSTHSHPHPISVCRYHLNKKNKKKVNEMTYRRFLVLCHRFCNSIYIILRFIQEGLSHKISKGTDILWLQRRDISYLFCADQALYFWLTTKRSTFYWRKISSSQLA